MTYDYPDMRRDANRWRETNGTPRLRYERRCKEQGVKPVPVRRVRAVSITAATAIAPLAIHAFV